MNNNYAIGHAMLKALDKKKTAIIEHKGGKINAHLVVKQAMEKKIIR